MRSTANTVLEHTLGKDVVCKRKKVVRKTKVVRGKEKVVRGAGRVVRAPPPRVARDLIFVEVPRHSGGHADQNNQPRSRGTSVAQSTD